MNRMYDVKDLIREARLKAYYNSLSPNFISSTKVSATLHVEVEKKVKIIKMSAPNS